MFGEAFLAQEALDLGLANKIVPAAELLGYANQQAAKLVALPAVSLRATKRLMRYSETKLINEVMQQEFQ